MTSTAGLNVFSVLLVFYVAYDAVSQSFGQQFLTAAPGVQSPPGFTPPFDIDMLALELPLSVLVALTVAAIVSHEAVRFWAIQQFAESPFPTLQERARLLLAVWYGPAAGMGRRLPIIASVAVAPILLVTVYLRQEIALTAPDPPRRSATASPDSAGPPFRFSDSSCCLPYWDGFSSSRSQCSPRYRSAPRPGC